VAIFKPGQIVLDFGVYDPVHPDMRHEVTVVKGRRFPTCGHCKGITFDLVHAASTFARCRSCRRRQPLPGSSGAQASAINLTLVNAAPPRPRLISSESR
jgi:hypothetical protein